MRSKVFSKKDTINKIKDLQLEESTEINLKNPPLVKDTGGSIYNLPINTPEYNKWVSEKQEKNTFIGSKYIEPAPELCSESQMEESSEEDATDELLDIEKSNMGYDANKDTTKIVVDTDIENIKKNKSDKKYIDFCIVEKVTRLLLGVSIEEIKESVEDELKSYHGDLEYKSEIDISKAILHNEVLLLENKKNDIKQIKNDEKNDDSAI